MVGVEPDDSGVAHRRVTATLHLLGGLPGRPSADPRRRPRARSRILAWVGWESNPREDGLSVRCTANICYRPGTNGVSCHPLGSNQDLSGFSRARRPTVPRWTGAPSPGIEPGPLGFQPSAQTHCARMGRGAARRGNKPAARHVSRDGCLPGHPHRHRSSVVRDLPRRALGAPRAGAQSRSPQLHLSRIRYPN